MTPVCGFVRHCYVCALNFGSTAAIYVPTVVFYVCKFGDHCSQLFSGVTLQENSIILCPYPVKPFGDGLQKWSGYNVCVLRMSVCLQPRVCVCVCVCACMRACVRACVRVSLQPQCVYCCSHYEGESWVGTC